VQQPHHNGERPVRTTSKILLAATLGLLSFAEACLEAKPTRQAPRAASPTAAVEPARRLAALKAKVMSADYRADLEELDRLRDESLPLGNERGVGHLAYYWAAFASWRIAMNGANHDMSREDIEAHLQRAVTDFGAAIRQRDDFADGYAALASVHGWLGALNAGDPALLEEHVTRARRLLRRAKELAPDNPRVLWVEGGFHFFRPGATAADQQRAIDIYRRAVELADAAGKTTSPLPDWGKPEALMSVAFVHLKQRSPDFGAAAEEARAALRLQPEWSYVRDVLLPQIEAAQRKQAAASE
jgi:hypothetical protein